MTLMLVASDSGLQTPDSGLMKEAVELIVKHLVREADEVDVREVERDRSTSVIEIRVAQGDVGKVIGRQGRTVKALRSLLHAAGQKHNRRYVLEIVEE